MMLIAAPAALHLQTLSTGLPTMAVLGTAPARLCIEDCAAARTHCSLSGGPRCSLCAVSCAVSCCSQGIVYGKPVNQGITQLKPNRNHRSMAEERAGRKLGALRVLNSYWVNQVRQGREQTAPRGVSSPQRRCL